MSNLSAIIKNGIIDNIIVGDLGFAQALGTAVDVTGLSVGIGWSYAGGVFTAPVVAPAVPVVVQRNISVGAFKDRLGLDTFAIANSTHPICIALKETLAGRKSVNLDSAKMSNFLNMLISANLPEAHVAFPGSGPLTLAKKNAIISAPIQPDEMP